MDCTDLSWGGLLRTCPISPPMTQQGIALRGAERREDLRFCARPSHSGATQTTFSFVAGLRALHA